MTEYDYSPEAAERYYAKIRSVGRWAAETDSERTFSGLKDPHTPATPAADPYPSLPNAHSSSRHRRSSVSRRDRERDRDRDRISRPQTAPPPGDVYGEYVPKVPVIGQTGVPRPPPLPLQMTYNARYAHPSPSPSPLSPNYNPYHSQQQQPMTASAAYLPHTAVNMGHVPHRPQPTKSYSVPAPRHPTNYRHPAAVQPVPGAPIPIQPIRSSTSPVIPIYIPEPEAKRSSSPLLKRVFAIFGGNSTNNSARRRDSSESQKSPVSASSTRYSEDSRHSSRTSLGTVTSKPTSPRSHSRMHSYDNSSRDHDYYHDDRGRTSHSKPSSSSRSKSTHGHRHRDRDRDRDRDKDRDRSDRHHRRDRRNSYT